MDNKCVNCRFRMNLQKWDYSNGGCKHSDYDGFACIAFICEGIVIHMIGLEDNDGCEMYMAKDIKH